MAIMARKIMNSIPPITTKQIHTKLKTNLKLVIQRLKMIERKKTEMGLKARKEIAGYLQEKKFDKARIKVEHIIREDYVVEAYEILEMFCDLVLARFGLLEFSKELDPGLTEAIASIIWAVPRLKGDVRELEVLSNMFGKLFTKEFVDECQTNVNEKVNSQLIHRVTAYVPSKKLVEMYLVEIGKNFKVDYRPDLPNEDITQPPPLPPPSDPPSGGNSGVPTTPSSIPEIPPSAAVDSTIIPVVPPTTPEKSLEPAVIEVTNFIKPQISPTDSPTENGTAPPVSDFDDLMSRFNKLKNS